MTWHEKIFPAAELLASLSALRGTGATITSCVPCPEGYRVTYVTSGPEGGADPALGPVG